MADPRLAVGHDGVGKLDASYKIDNSTITYSATAADGSTVVGRAVTLSADDTVALAADAEAVIGKLNKVEADGIASVQVGGFMTLPSGTGASLTLGKKIVGCLLVAAKGYIREVNTGAAVELGVAVGKIMNNDDTAAVWVKLD